MPTEGVNVTAVLADFVVSAVLVAVTVTELEVEMEAGAVNNPLEEIVPRFGLKDHTTPVLVVPVTVAENCWDCDCCRLIPEGPSETRITGATVTVAWALAPFAEAVIVAF